MLLQLCLSLLLLWIRGAAAAALADCPKKCGNITIPYPFGIGDGCYRHEELNFSINCNSSAYPPKAFLRSGNIEVIEIEESLEAVIVKNKVASACYDKTTGEANRRRRRFRISSNSPYRFSQSRNILTVIGCNIEAEFRVDRPMEFISGCKSECADVVGMNASCPGIGCCQTEIPEGIKRINISAKILSNNKTGTPVQCGYALLANKDNSFNMNILSDVDRNSILERSFPVVLDWVAGNGTCEQAPKNQTSYACKENSDCVPSTNGPGYKCKCRDGYRGNPYISQGCQGGHNCSCPKGTYGDGKIDGKGCIKKEESFIKIIVAISMGFLAVLIVGSWIYWGLKQRRHMKLREKYFKQNGGLLLQQQISRRRGETETSKIFTAKELQKATNNYAENQIIGKGGSGTVYKGILADNRVVAIKKSKVIDETQIKQFINEVFILSQINHRNVVKLLGCCLETQVALLVYEYVPSGTLFRHIHGEGHISSLSLSNRLRIATEIAGALAYLHSSASIPIFHRDVKSTNILLDDNYTAKVSDFGASRLVPVDKNQLTTLVQGTLGYLDPEYMITSQLTEKSDVYSFGVVLAELLTGKMPIVFERSEEERNLSMLFVSAMKQNRLLDILESRVVDEGGVEQLLAVSQLAKRCLKVKGDERPRMTEVAAVLEGLSRFEQHPWVQQSELEMESLELLGEQEDCGEGSSTDFNSLKSYAILDIDMAK